LIHKKQDARLDVMSEGLSRLKDVSHRIADELDEHNLLLDELDKDVSDTNSRIAFVTNQTKELIAKSGGTKWFCMILALSILAFVLFFLIIS
jgi:syntaxin 6/SYP6 family syntaxin